MTFWQEKAGTRKKMNKFRVDNSELSLGSYVSLFSTFHCLFGLFVHFVVLNTKSDFVTQPGLKIMIFVPQPLEC